MKFQLTKKALIIAMLLLLPRMLYAHGLETTFQQLSGNYTLEFEYDAPGNIKAGDFTTFTVYLLNANHDSVGFDSAFITIRKLNGAPVLSGNLIQSADVPGSSRMGGVIKDPGEYASEIHFVKSDKELAQATYKFTVDPSLGSPTVRTNTTSGRNWTLAALVGIAGLVLGLSAGLKLKRKK
jgi:hypothetical protein